MTVYHAPVRRRNLKCPQQFRLWDNSPPAQHQLKFSSQVGSSWGWFEFYTASQEDKVFRVGRLRSVSFSGHSRCFLDLGLRALVHLQGGVCDRLMSFSQLLEVLHLCQSLLVF